MPWRKRTLTPFLSGDSASAGESIAASSDKAQGSAVSNVNLFGSSDFGIDWNFTGLENFGNGPVLDANVSGSASADDTVSVAPMSKRQFDQFLGHSFLSGAQATDIKMPWEKGIFKEIFGEEHSQPALSLAWFPRAEVLEDCPEATVHELATVADRKLQGEDPVYARAILCVSDLDHKESQAKLLQVACNKWLSILLICLHASDVGRNIASLGPIEVHHWEALDPRSRHRSEVFSNCDF